MTVEEVKEAYEKKFGGLPMFLLMSADDEYIVEALSKCLETGQEYQGDEDDVY